MKALLFLLTIATLLTAADTNKTDHIKLDNKTKAALEKAIEKEKKYAKEQRFYTGKEYDLKSEEVDPETVKKVPLIEPEYDFDMDTGVYDD
ncbi:MAG: hypothetical protein DSZ05_04815 [Sulfurospirillum sp.]|nr:MAG: hypothetical protein DSZ05_04815 [Sulfurospirillum sp.]